MTVSIEKDTMVSFACRDTKKAVDRWFYRRKWIRTETPRVGPAEPGRWMIFMDSVGLGKQISAQLNGAQHQVIEVRPGKAFTRVRKGEYLVRPGNRADYDALILDVIRRGTLPQRIIHLWSVCDDSQRVSVDETLDLSFYSLVNLAQTLKDQDLTGVDIAIISNRLQSVSSERIANPIRATLLGPVRVVPKDIPGVVCRSIDCDPIDQGTGYVAVQIIAEHLSPFTDEVVAYRGDERWIESLQRLELNAAATHRGVKHGAVYLITGGLSRVGLVVAEHLARNFQARLILVDQTPLPPGDEWNEMLGKGTLPEHTQRTLHKLSEMRSLGCEVVTVCADVTRPDEMKHAIELARTKCGHINGVIHAAAVTDCNPLPLKTRDGVARVLESKIKATLTLDEFLSDESVDFFALFSSLSSLIGRAGQIDDAAASAFLDAFASSQQERRVVAIDCAPWVDDNQPVDSLSEQRTESSFGILPSEGAEAFTKVLSADLPPTVIMCAQDLTSVGKTEARSDNAPVISKDEVESVLLRWWQEFSDSRQLSLDDNFFDLGGNSLAGVQLFSKIKTTYGLNMGLATLFEAPTIRQLAQLIRQASGSSHAKPKPWSPVVPIQPKGKRPRLYVISGLGGNVIKFHSLAFHLGEDQPMYGLLPRGLDGKDSFLTRIEDMAACYVEAIRTVQPEGPYCLAGYSFGGIVAFEVAWQIMAQGGNVKFLGLFDTIEWHYADKVDGSLRPGERIEVVTEHLRNMLFGKDRYAYVKNVLKAKIQRIKHRLMEAPDQLVSPKIGALEEANGYAAANYHPKVYPGKLTLFRSTKRAAQQGNDEYLGWGELAAAGVQVHHVPGTHFNILQEPGVRVVAEKLRSCLERDVEAR